MTVIPTHKNCGDPLNEKQAETFQKDLVKSWGFEEQDQYTKKRKSQIVFFYNCDTASLQTESLHLQSWLQMQ